MLVHKWHKQTLQDQSQAGKVMEMTQIISKGSLLVTMAQIISKGNPPTLKNHENGKNGSKYRGTCQIHMKQRHKQGRSALTCFFYHTPQSNKNSSNSRNPYMHLSQVQENDSHTSSPASLQKSSN